MPRTYRAAIIGLGGFSRAHARAYAETPRVEFVAACDLVAEKHASWLERVRPHVSDGYGARWKSVRHPKWRLARVDPAALENWGMPYACRHLVRDLIRCIERGQPSRCSGREARAALEITMAIYESERTGGPVRLPLERKTSPLPEMTRKGGYGEVTWKMP